MNNQDKNNKTYVWYLGYGSNLSEQRFLCYIKGGKSLYGKKSNKSCGDKTPPVGDKPYKIPYRLYFALPDGLEGTKNWGPGGVAFIKTRKVKKKENWTYCRMWKITKEQYEHVRDEEGRTWYDKEILIKKEAGIPIYTITSKKNLRNILPASNTYLKTIALGFKEIHKLTSKKITEYLRLKEGIKGKLTREELSVILRDISS